MPPQIKSVANDPPQPLSMILYGPHKVGKTSFVATMPDPVFIVPQGRGTGSLKEIVDARRKENADAADISYIPVATRAEMEEACLYVRNNSKEHGWQTCALDPLSTYGRMVVSELEASGVTGWDVWRAVQQDIINNWNLLMGAPLHVVFVMHVDEAKMNDVVVGYKPKLVGKTIDDIAASVDMIAFMQKKDVQVRDNDGNLTGETQSKRLIFTKSFASGVPFEAGCRWENQLEKGAYPPDWAVIADLLKGHVLT